MTLHFLADRVLASKAADGRGTGGTTAFGFNGVSPPLSTLLRFAPTLGEAKLEGDFVLCAHRPSFDLHRHAGGRSTRGTTAPDAAFGLRFVGFSPVGRLFRQRAALSLHVSDQLLVLEIKSRH